MTLYKLTTEIKNAYLASVKSNEVTNSDKGNKTFLNFVFASNGETINAWANADDFTTLPEIDKKYNVTVSVSSKIGVYNKETSYLSVKVISITEAE